MGGPSGAGAILALTAANELEMAAIGAALARRLTPGDAVGLSGPLGAGKTVLARAMVRALMIDPHLEVPSPSFTIVQEYERRPDGLLVWHVDLYRLDDPTEIDELGLDEALEAAVVLIEWPERAHGHLPDTALEVVIDLLEGERRRIRFSGQPGWTDRLAPVKQAVA